eukprot:432885-Pleurochrysis_carterae.AAC.1
MKGFVSNWLLAAADEIISDLNELFSNQLGTSQHHTFIDEASACVRTKLDVFNGIRTEHLEAQYLRKHVPVVNPVRRMMPRLRIPTARNSATPPTSTPHKDKDLVAYDFPVDELFARLMEHSATARDAVYETLVTWTARPPTPSSPVRVIADVTDGRVFLDHPVFGLRARVSQEEAEKASATSPIK